MLAPAGRHACCTLYTFGDEECDDWIIDWLCCTNCPMPLYYLHTCPITYAWHTGLCLL